MRHSSLAKAQRQIAHYFDGLHRRVFSQEQLFDILEENRDRWKIAKRVGLAEFLRLLLEKSKLRTADLTSIKYPSISRYTWSEYSPFELGASLKSNCYLSHASALFPHNLADHPPSTIYVNREQSLKPPSRAPLTQESLDRAFEADARRSQYVLNFMAWQFVLLSGKHTARLSVSPIRGPQGEIVPATSLVRTLIDVAVRPEYGGGVLNVLSAYRAARGRFQVAALVSVLETLDYVYPFHQAIGFYMSMAGFPRNELSPLRSRGLRLNFYLAHAMKEKDFDASWRVFYPKALQNG